MEEFKFMFDIMQVNLLAWRAVANTYPLWFFMRGPAKKKFFDFVQAELELSLEKLSKLLTQDLTEFIEMGEDKSKLK